MNKLKHLNKILYFICKIILWGIGAFASIIIMIILFLYICEWVWPEMLGSYDLGNKIYLLDWDEGTKIIVRGTSIHGKTCYGGSYLIPTYENACDSLGNFAEYVVDAKSDNKWIIVKTDNKLNHTSKYYIMNKKFDSEKINEEKILQKYVWEFKDSTEFADRCKQEGIQIKW